MLNRHVVCDVLDVKGEYKCVVVEDAAEDAAVPDVFLLVFLSYLDVPSICFQLVGGDLPQNLLVNWEEHLQTTLFYVIIPVGQRVIIIINMVKITAGKQSESKSVH